MGYRYNTITHSLIRGAEQGTGTCIRDGKLYRYNTGTTGIAHLIRRHTNCQLDEDNFSSEPVPCCPDLHLERLLNSHIKGLDFTGAASRYELEDHTRSLSKSAWTNFSLALSSANSASRSDNRFLAAAMAVVSAGSAAVPPAAAGPATTVAASGPAATAVPDDPAAVAAAADADSKSERAPATAVMRAVDAGVCTGCSSPTRSSTAPGTSAASGCVAGATNPAFADDKRSVDHVGDEILPEVHLPAVKQQKYRRGGEIPSWLGSSHLACMRHEAGVEKLLHCLEVGPVVGAEGDVDAELLELVEAGSGRQAPGGCALEYHLEPHQVPVGGDGGKDGALPLVVKAEQADVGIATVSPGCIPDGHDIHSCSSSNIKDCRCMMDTVSASCMVP